MKKITLLLSLLIISVSFGQIPTGYYNTATGSGYTLKTQLYNIINNQTDLGYGGLWVTYQTSDRDVFTGVGYENDNTIYDMYTENPTGSAGECSYIYGTDQDTGSGGSTECDVYNREHIIPQSIFSQNAPMRHDAHFVTPTDKKVNGDRGDNPHGTVATVYSTTNNGGKHGSSAIAGYTGQVFEPIDAFKGDIARMYFYFATRYQTQLSSWSYPMFNGTSDQVFTTPFLNMLLTWHNNDPVSTFEITRNNAIYARQNNRNPFIDHPEYVCQIYSAQCAALSIDSIVFNNSINIYPNPSINSEVNVSTEMELKSIFFYNINGQLIQEINNPSKIENNTYRVSNLPKGFYFIKLSTDNQSVTKKVIIN